MASLDELVAALPSATLQQVAQLMFDNHCSSVVIVDDLKTKKAAGLITSSDIVAAFAKSMDGNTTLAKDVMTVNVTSVPHNSPKDIVSEKLMKEKRHHIFVVDDHKNVVGIISSLDIVVESALDAKAWPYTREGLKSYFK